VFYVDVEMSEMKREGVTRYAEDTRDSATAHQKSEWWIRYRDNITLYLRLALGIDFLSAVADRLGWWGPPGTPNVAWGNFQNFLSYTAKLNPWFPASWIPTVGWVATICEICFGVALIIGYRTRLAAVLSGLLALAFALGMIFGLGVHSTFDYSVFAVSAGAFLLAAAERYRWSLDSFIR